MKEKIKYKEHEFDSNEEMYFYWWCEELLEKGIIKDIVLQPSSFILSTKVDVYYAQQLKTKSKTVKKTILNGHVYTTDFAIIWANNTYQNKLFFEIRDLSNFRDKKAFQYFVSDELVSYVEVKPLFDQNNMTRLAKINQKWVYEKYEVFVNIIKPEELFNLTFTPKNYLITNKSSKSRKIKYNNVISLDDFLLSSYFEK